jgi:sarcosine oxidase subunit beta
MTAPKSYDVIVVGAGSVGTPTALALAGSGLKVLVIDRLPSVGQGSNKRAIGGLRATHSDPAKIRLCLRSLEIFATWRDLVGDDIEWHKGGYSYVAYRPEEERTLKELLAGQKAGGLNIDWLDAPALLEVIPDRASGPTGESTARPSSSMPPGPGGPRSRPWPGSTFPSARIRTRAR